MKVAPAPSNEKERLQLLQELEVLDSPQEQVYDDLVHLAVEVCRVDIAVVSLVDDKRQWFKSKFGIDVCETDRDISFCSHAILADEPLIIHDALLDSRFSDNPLVCEEPKIRFYAGFPLIFNKDLRLGTICLISREPRKLDSIQVKIMQLLAKQIVILLQSKMRENQKEVLQRKIVEQEKKAAAASKLAVLGEMSAGIAHEINNPLAIILANSAELMLMAKQEVVNKDELTKVAEGIERVSLRLARTVAALRSFSRDGECVKMEVFSLDSIYSDTLELCRKKLSDQGVQLRFNNHLPGVQIYCRPVEISQVLLNLLNNAIDAVSEQEIKLVDWDTKFFDGYIEISISNNGPMIPKDIRDKIMHPFFTTKAAGKGTGLGLSISQRIASSHGGSLILDDSSSSTKFVLKLPFKN